MMITNASVLAGPELDFVPSTRLYIQDGIFTRPRGGGKSFDCEGLLVIPGFVNAHTHIGDSIGKDVTLDISVDKRIHPVYGIKSKILERTSPELLSAFMRNTCHSMIKKGTTTFVDFREGGLQGIMLLKRALVDIPIRPVILGRINIYHGPTEIKKNSRYPSEKSQDLDALVGECDGLGISGANENSLSMLGRYSQTAKLRAIHSSETIQSVSRSKSITGKSETVRALRLKPHFLVHMTYASESDLCVAAKKIRGIVVCPRANASLAEGIPDVDLMMRTGCMVALGTDNVMINSPDMFREMDFLWKATMGLRRKRIDPREILKMATVNGGKILKKNIGVIQLGMSADCIFLDKHALDLEPMHNPHASIVHRASESAVRAVMIGGKIVYGKI